LHPAKLPSKNCHYLGKIIIFLNQIKPESRSVKDSWYAIWLMIVFALVFGWCLCQVDFVLAYTQAPIKMDMYMELPDGIE